MGIRLVNHHRKRSAIMPDLKKYLFFCFSTIKR
mgnify:FL=1